MHRAVGHFQFYLPVVVITAYMYHIPVNQKIDFSVADKLPWLKCASLICNKTKGCESSNEKERFPVFLVGSPKIYFK